MIGVRKGFQPERRARPQKLVESVDVAEEVEMGLDLTDPLEAGEEALHENLPGFVGIIVEVRAVSATSSQSARVIKVLGVDSVGRVGEDDVKSEFGEGLEDGETISLKEGVGISGKGCADSSGELDVLGFILLSLKGLHCLVRSLRFRDDGVGEVVCEDNVTTDVTSGDVDILLPIDYFRKLLNSWGRSTVLLRALVAEIKETFRGLCTLLPGEIHPPDVLLELNLKGVDRIDLAEIEARDHVLGEGVITAANGLAEVPDVLHRPDTSLARDQDGFVTLLSNDDGVNKAVGGDA